MKGIFQISLIIGLTIFSLTGILVIILKAYDFYLIKKEIFSRKDIGNFEVNELWYKNVKDICCKWIIRMPKIPVRDNDNFVFLEKITGKYYKNELQAWQKAGLFLGMAQYSKEHSGDTKTNDSIKEALYDVFDENYNWRVKPDQIDYALLAYSVMKLEQYNENYYGAICEIVNVIKNNIGGDGTVFYRRNIPNYRLVDTLGMICPFLIRFGYLYNKPDLVDLALFQLEQYMKYGVHSYTSIPAHAYHIHNKMPLGIYGWGRGTGWYVLGLIDSYEELEDSHPKKEFLHDKIKGLSIALVEHQRLDGGWGHSLFVENNIYDSSATAMILYFLKKAIQFDIISDDKLVETVKKGIKKLKLSTRTDGTVDFSQGDTKDIGIYSTVFREFPFTQGIVLGLLSI